MRVEVRQRHIDEGVPIKGETEWNTDGTVVKKSCPVELAIREVLGGEDKRPVYVGEIRIYIGTTAIDTPVQVRKWIEAFDAGEKVLEFDFDLNMEGGE